MSERSNRSTSLHSAIIRISIAGGNSILQFSNLWWLHHQSNHCGHSCLLCLLVRLYLTQFLSSDIIFMTRVKGCTYVKQFEIYKSLYNITAWKWLVSALCYVDSVRYKENVTYRVYRQHNRSD